MSLDQRYIKEYCDAIHTVNGKYKVHCPECRTLPTKKGKLKPNSRTAVLFPIEKCNSKYGFYCSRCKAEGRRSGMEFLPYLFSINTTAAERYKAEKNGYADLINGFKFQPKFNK